MDNQIITPNGNGHKPTQVGPPWRCFECGAPASRLACYTEYTPAAAVPKPLDAWGAHIWYLLGLTCNHSPRVARLGNAITPLVTYTDDDNSERHAIARVREALAAIAAAHGPNSQRDPAAAIVWQLVAGAITPTDAIREIHDLAAQEAINVIP